MAPDQAEQAQLYKDLLSIYARAGAEVTYETDRGETRPYWAKRYLQAVKRAKRNDEVLEFVHRLVRQEEVSRGFLILKKAGRLDLTVEALVVDETRPYHAEFDINVVQTAKQRLADHGHQSRGSAPTSVETPTGTPSGVPVVKSPAGTIGSTSAEPRLSPGTSFDVRITVEHDGKLSLALI